MTRDPKSNKPMTKVKADEKKLGSKPHTELRRVGEGLKPRAKVLPPELRDEPGDDDLFNDMPV